MGNPDEPHDIALPINQRTRPPSILATPTSSFTVPQQQQGPLSVRGPTTSGGRRAWADYTPGAWPDASPMFPPEAPPAMLFPPTPTPTARSRYYGGSLGGSIGATFAQAQYPQSSTTFNSMAPTLVQQPLPAQQQMLQPQQMVPAQQQQPLQSQQQQPQPQPYIWQESTVPTVVPASCPDPGSNKVTPYAPIMAGNATASQATVAVPENGAMMPFYGAVLVGVPVGQMPAVTAVTTAMPVSAPAAEDGDSQSTMANAGRQVLLEAYGGLGADAEGAPDSNAQVSSTATPSIGSAAHGTGQCRPCAWYWKAQGCQNGASCTYCHLCPEDELKRRKKEKVAAMRMGALEPSKPGEAPTGVPRTLKLGPLL